MMDKLRRFVNGDESPDEESGIIQQINDATTLRCTTRLKLFAVCFVTGILLSFLGSFALFFNRGLTVFAVFYTLGNIVSLASTCFLMGPFKQIAKMFHKTRAIATTIMIVTFALTLWAAFGPKKAILALIFIIMQSLAMTWYSLSYIPYARYVAKKTFTTMIV